MSIGRMISRGALILKRQSPHIFMGLGIGAGIASTIFACKGTLKAQEILLQHKMDIEDIHASKEYTEPTEYRMEIIDAYRSAALDLFKVYFPAILLGATSVASILGGYNILNKRFAGMLAVYSGLQKSFNEYRSRVLLAEGPDLDARCLADGVPVKAQNNQTTNVSTVEVVDPSTVSQYARFFDSTSDCWVNDAEQNLLFLRHVQEEMNRRLKKRGHVFLNEVYEELGFEPSTEGAFVGWVLDEGGNNFIDFGLYNIHVDDPAKRLFINGIERVVLLDFNVDGVIYDLI